MSGLLIASSGFPTIYTYGGGEILRQTFVAISMLCKNDGILGPLMFLCAVLGGGIIVCKLFGTLAIDSLWMQYFVPFLGIYAIFMMPTTTILIKDVLHGPEMHKVDNVPRFLAHFAEIATSIGYYATLGFETAMHTVDDVKYSETGRVFGADTAIDFKRFQITNADLQKNFREFSKQCVLYDLALGRYSFDELKKSTDIWNFLKARSSNLGMIYYCPTEGTDGTEKNQCEYVSCIKALEKFEPLFDKEKSYYAKQEIGKNLPLTFQALTNIKEDSQKLIGQQLMINVLSDQFSSQKFAQDRAYTQQITTYQNTGFWASKILVIGRCVFEALIYATFIFVLPLSLLPSGIKYLLTWIWSVIWIQFWPPLFVVLNYIASIYTKMITGDIHEGISDKGLSIFTNLGLQNFANDSAALAGYLMLSVPVLSYYLLQGSLSHLVQLAGTMTSPLQSAASSASAEQTSGNYSYDNVSIGQQSYGNTTAFQSNSAPSLSDGYMIENKGSERIEYASDNVIYTQNASSLMSSINADEVYGSSLQHQRQHAESYAATTSQQYQESVAHAVNTGTNLVSHLAHSDNFNEGLSSREAYDAQQSVRHMESAADNWGKGFNLSSKQSLDLSMAAGVGLNAGFSVEAIKGLFGFGGSADVKGSGSYNFGADEGKIMSAAMNFAQSEEFQSNYQKVKDYAATVASSSSTDEGVRLAQDFTQSLNESQNYQQANQAALTQLDQASDSSSWYEQNSHLIKDNLNQKYFNWAIDKFNDQYQDGSGFNRMQELMQSSNPEDQRQVQGLVYEFVQSEIDSQAGISNPARYQDPTVGYANADISKVDRQQKLNEVHDDYSDNATGIHSVYGAPQDYNEKIIKDFESAKETQDAFAFFTQNDIQYNRNAGVNQLNFERQRKLRHKIYTDVGGSVTSTEYKLNPPPFWQR
jgi:conjugal transfer mating pair stabilization protein TraG